ncbi:DNA invertase Pin-like site-specific DNA recombinase [Bradyrhizobium ottawaense]
MTTVLYARVSTTEQTLDHQQAQAEAAGFKIDEVVADDGVSGITTRLAHHGHLPVRTFILADSTLTVSGSDL